MTLEYRVENISAGPLALQHRLNDFAGQGWRLHTILTIDNMYDKVKVILERQAGVVPPTLAERQRAILAKQRGLDEDTTLQDLGIEVDVEENN